MEDFGKREVFPISKESQTRRVWRCRAGNEDCKRDDPCRSCLGRRSRRAGQVKQRAAKKLLGVPDGRFRGQTANEEAWRHDLLRIEVKSGAQVQPIATKYLLAEQQSGAAKAIGDPRPFCLVAMPTNFGNEGLVVIRATAFRRLLESVHAASEDR